MSIYSTFEYFDTLLSLPDTVEIARKEPQYFTRNSKLGLVGLLKFIISRQGYTITNEINHYFSAFDLEKVVSKQVIFQVQEKLNFEVFPFINRNLCRYFYQNNEYKTSKVYTVIAIDGSVAETPYTEENCRIFRINTPNKNNLFRTSPRISGFYDINNNIYIDTLIQSYKDSEIPMAYE